MSRLRVVLTLTVALALVLAFGTDVLAQPPVMGVYGTATVGGERAAEGTEVLALIDGQVVARVNISGGAYNMNIVQPQGASYEGKTVYFTVSGAVAPETAVWRPGLNLPLNLTVPGATLVVLALSNIAGQYTIVWMYDAQSGRWRKYDPAVPWVSDLTALERGQTYWIKATQDTTLAYGGNIYPLAQGWNTIAWLG